MHWKLQGSTLDLSATPLIMGIVNATPDSFSNDGVRDGAGYAKKLMQEGARIIDIGGESSRPGAVAVSENEEWQRIEATVARLIPETIVSVDTAKAGIARQALELGAHIINDIGGGQNLELLEAVSQAKAGYVLMHNKRNKPAMDTDPITHLTRFFEAKLKELSNIGISPEHLVLDPGLGFGWSQEDNYFILGNLHRLVANVNRPVLIGASRKGFIGAVTGQKIASDRVAGSIAAGIGAVEAGAQILRVHDVAATQEALKVWQAIYP